MAAVLAVVLAAYGATFPSDPGEKVSPLPDSGLPTTAAVVESEPAKDKLVRILVDGREINKSTTAETVGLAINDAGIEIRHADQVEPSMNSWLHPNSTITITRAHSYTVAVNDQDIQILTHYTKTADVLSEAGIGLIGEDFSNPPLEASLIPGQTVEVIRVTEEIEIEEIPIPFETIWQGTDSLEIDQREQLSAGVPGSLQRETVVQFQNGKEVARSAGLEWVAREPVNEVIGFGTNIVVRTLETEVGPIEYWRVVKMRVTAYTPSSAGKPPGHPSYGITASGLPAGKGIVAIDPRVVPFRSKVYVKGYGIGLAGDTGGGVKGRWIDLGYDDGTIIPWRGYVDVYYLTPVPSADKINYLIPQYLP